MGWETCRPKWNAARGTIGMAASKSGWVKGARDLARGWQGGMNTTHWWPHLWHKCSTCVSTPLAPSCKWSAASFVELKKAWINVYSWTRDSKPTWCAVHHPLIEGVPAIPGGWQFVQRYVGRFCIHCNYRGFNPGLFPWANASSLSSIQWLHKTWPKRRSHCFCQSTRWALTWDRVGNTLECRHNEPLIWQACTRAQQSCQISHSPWRWSWHQFWPWSLVAITLTVAMGRLDNSLHPWPSTTTIGYENCGWPLTMKTPNRHRSGVRYCWHQRVTASLNWW